MDLNDYCLLDIFTSDSLTATDLCSLAETCERFKQLAERAFPYKFSILRDWSENYSEPDISNVTGEKEDIDRILKRFGSRLDEFAIDDTNLHIVELVAKYCGNVTLSRLEMHGITDDDDIRTRHVGGSALWNVREWAQRQRKRFSLEKLKKNRFFRFHRRGQSHSSPPVASGPEDIIVQLKSIFQRLLALDVSSFDFSIMGNNLNCDSLTYLKITGSNGIVALLENNFPNLLELEIEEKGVRNNIAGGIDITGAVSDFIGRHTGLNHLALSGASMYCNNELISTIGNSCENLDTLFLENLKNPEISFDISKPLSMPQLTELNTNINSKNCNQIIALLQASTSLEMLGLFSMQEIPLRVFDPISQLKHLRELLVCFKSYRTVPWTMLTQLRTVALHGYDEIAADLSNIIMELPNLEHLIFYCTKCPDLLLSEEDFNHIAKRVEQRPKDITLKCKRNFDLPSNWNKNHPLKLVGSKVLHL